MSLFAGVPNTTLTTWLTEAQAAYHSLMTGAQTVYVQHQENRVQYSLATAGDLQRYIQSLQAELTIRAGSPAAKPYAVATWTR